MLFHVISRLRMLGLKAPALIVVILLILTTQHSPGETQNGYFSTEPDWISGSLDAVDCTALGDIDQDGDLDLVCGNYEPEYNITIYLNENGMLAKNPTHTLTVAYWIWDMTLGDVDGDGDLDLVCGNEVNNTLLLNDGGIFSTNPAWISGRAYLTTCVALGDVDGDGDLDLVCGNSDQYNTLYLNEAGNFKINPDWISDLTNRTLSIALGDVDNDGDLDLACGNGIPGAIGQKNTLYINEGGVFRTSPDWLSSEEYATRSIALGDIDGDGDFDLVCGNFGYFDQQNNFYGESNTLYTNEGGTFSSIPTWSSGEKNATMAIDLGDVDRDGDLDLACGNTVSCKSTLYLNESGIFNVQPAWSSGPEIHTQSVNLGDIDGDGDLDFVCGNAEVNVLYLNKLCPFSATAYWSSEPELYTTSVALGDVDSDGDLDIVCGNDGSSNHLYLNYDSLVFPEPFWSSEPENYTVDVALEDIDGDGDLDLVCGNLGHSNTCYLNYGSSFSSSPFWSSGPTNRTWSVALGDIDSDSDLDLVCGNEYQPNTLYFNTGGVFSSTPDWLSDPINLTHSVILEDIDRDGDLDLICANGWLLDGESNAIYLNEGGIFSTTPNWQSIPLTGTLDVVSGDVDGDGDKDLLFGNDGINTLYLNENGLPSTSPVWSPGSFNTAFSVALEDINGDGSLDFICGNLSIDTPHPEHNTLFLNEGGTYPESPLLLSTIEDNTFSIILRDIDEDGDLDLICGNYYLQSNTLQKGIRNPVFSGDPLAPVNHLPNNSAFVKTVGIQQLNVTQYLLSVKIIDVESDPVWIIPQYQYKGDPTWHALDIEGYQDIIGPLPSSPEGMQNGLLWNILPLLIDERDVVLRIRTISNPMTAGSIQYIPAYFKSIGPIDVRRPELTVSAEAISFPTVTVGDTASTILSIINGGNEILSITAVTCPSPEMRVDRATPFDLPPGESINLTLYLEPRLELAITGNIEIISNDPLVPVHTIPIQTDIRSLEVETRSLTEGEEAPLGDALTILVTPAEDVRLERGTLYYRPGDGTTTFSEIELIRSGTSFSGVIKGEDVSEAGLEYYIEVENSGIFLIDPPGAPSDSIFTQAVEAPASIAANAVPNSGSAFMEERPIKIEVHLPVGADFVTGALHHRFGGESGFRVDTLKLDGVSYAAYIPDSLVGPRGLEYWVEVHTLTSTLTDPLTDPANTPHTIQVTVQNLIEDIAYPGNQYRMISIPLLFGDDFVGSIDALLAEQIEFGAYDPINWRSYRYIPDLSRYMELSEQGASEHFRPFPGRGFWLISKETNRITTAPITGYSMPTDSACGVPLSPGWNMIGDPFNFPVAWDSCLVDTLSMPEAGAFVEPPVRWIIGQGYQYNVEVLYPFEGYWVKNLHTSEVVLKVPPRQAPAAIPLDIQETIAVSAGNNASEEGWIIEITAKSAGTMDQSNFIGVYENASTQWDRNDRSEPPMSPGRSISLYFPHAAWERHPGNYTRDIRGTYEALNAGQIGLSISEKEIWGHLWRFDISKNFSNESAGDEVILEFTGLESIPPEAAIYLIDRHLKKFLDLRTENGYSFYLGTRDLVPSDEDTRFVLLVGSEEFAQEHEDELPKLPTVTALYQNYPNPFNPSTVIRYDLAVGGEVTLKIFDARGALIQTLFQGHREPGRYEIGWDGKNRAGLQVTTGIYFYRFETSIGFAETRKMLLIR